MTKARSHLLILPAFLCLSYCLGYTTALSQTLSGVVTNSSGTALPFANIFVQGTTNGTSSNIDGRYQLRITGERQTVVFQYMGYQSYELEIHGSGDLVRDVQLKKESVNLPEILVAAEEDPAYGIMRKAIAARKSHLEQVQSYSCKAYVKGFQRLIDAPDKLFGQSLNIGTASDSNSNGILYLSESESILHFEQPNKIKETVISSKVSGDDQGFSWNQASDFYFNFYENHIDIEFLSERVFISPVAENAMLYYDFKLLGIFEEDGRLINKIRVKPRRAFDPAFTGTVNIIENEWSFHALELFLTKANQINFIDTLQATQYFVEVQNGIRMPSQQRFDISFDLFKVKGDGYYLGVFNDYVINNAYEKRFFTNEVVKVEEEANEKSEEYWGTNRPVPLTEIEAEDYVIKDSLQELRKSKTYLDSIDKIENKFSPLDLISGYDWQNSYKKIDISINGLADFVQYNTVEGWNIHIKPSVRKELSNKRFFNFRGTFKYGFSGKRPYGAANFRYLANRKRSSMISFGGGHSADHFNQSEPISASINTLYSLIAERNYMKLVERNYGYLNYRREVVNGLFARIGLEFNEYKRLENTTDFTFRNVTKRTFSENNRHVPSPEVYSEPVNKSILLRAGFRFRPGQQYISRPDMKVNLGSVWPEFGLSITKAISFGSSFYADYTKLTVAVRDDTDFGLFGTFKYHVRSAVFLGSKRLPFSEYIHFNGNRTHFSTNHINSFQLLPYYKYSTNDWMAELHAEHHFNGFLLNKVPGFRKLKFQVVTGFNYLYTEDLSHYFEFSVGLENILKLIRTDVVFGFQPEIDRNKVGFRIGIDLDVFN